METIDMNKLNVAIKYLQRIADGCNPVNNMPADEESVLNNANVIRCMFFVKEVLEEVRRNNGVIGGSKTKAKGEPFPFEILKEFKYQEDKSIAHVLKQIYAPLEGKNIRKIAPQTVSTWFKNNGYLKMEYCEEVGKESAVPTEKGKEIGIYTELRTYMGRTYLAVMYDENAQNFIAENLETILND